MNYRIAQVFCLTLAVASPVWAQAAKSQLYGRGVHEYFSGNHQAALDSLTGSIDAGTADPRPYYFRGLVLLAAGKTIQAREDFQAGSELEAADSTRYYLVSKALERVQGAARLELETFRVSGRQKLNARKQQENDARYGRVRAAEPEVLRVPPKAGRLQPGADPFSDDPGQSEAGKAKPPAKEDTDEAPAAPKKPAKPAPEPAVEEKEEKPAAEEKKPAKPAAEEKEEKPAAEEKKPAKPAAEEKEEKPAAEEKKPAKPAAEEKEEKAEEKKPAEKEEKAEEKKPAEKEEKAEEKKPAEKEEKAEEKKPAEKEEKAEEKKPAEKEEKAEE